jgi:SAM-dependent methyltransferase
MTDSLTTTLPPPETTLRTDVKICRFCGSGLKRTFVNLGMSPLCETYPSVEDLNRGEVYYPLHVFVCEDCFLVQLEEYESREAIFSDYAYFSSYSDSWLKHCEKYCEKMIQRFGLSERNFVVEVASNDGYLLQYFVRRNVPVLGIEPAANVAKVAMQKGVPSLVEFFGSKLATALVAEGRRADLIAGNNVLAQVPDLNDFVEGLRILLKPAGVVTLEFPHLLRLIERNEFDTIYHEHFSYFSMLSTVRILEAHGLKVFDVEELTSHGGSLRVYACLAENQSRVVEPAVLNLLTEEEQAGLASPEGYDRFGTQVKKTKLALLDFLVEAARQGNSVAGYGAPGKSATLLHYCGITRDLLEYTVDRSPYKQGRFLPGTHIPIHAPSRIAETRPDYVVILPWNLREEIMDQLKYIRQWGGRFVVPIPEVAIY